ncbi:IclR family transcriptional regulator [Vibrio sp. HA2012]|uniref:IclR family transcriptional regulator n=1 Tax=Vibrio sp. HA2012 TaxID=1971595 RepID=UPI0018E25A59|nr:IclR family transcriptional regulator C-terminal domain-containing protein [Vibrio sp. HA2012]
MTTEKSTIGALEKGLLVLNCFTSSQLKLELKDIAESTELNKSTILRILAVMQDYHYIVRNDDGTYSVGILPSRLGARYNALFESSEQIEAVVRRISESINESVAYYVDEGDDRLCIYARNSNRVIQHRFLIGDRIPLSEGGSASHILRYYLGKKTTKAEDIRQKGYCVTAGERESEQTSISVPVFGTNGKLEGAIVVAGVISRLSEERMADIYQLICAEMIRGGLHTQA